jgi:predicted N-formylglutamate amidohydrolase
MSAAELLDGCAPVLLLCDHASDAVPPDIALGVPPGAMRRHIAVDIGAGALTRALAVRIGAPAVLGTVSRLVIDLHREPDHPKLIPTESDGQQVPGNIGADRLQRVARFHAPYHRTIARAVRQRRPALIVAIHSFTPRLEIGGTDRPWQCGVLYNRDTRAARPAVAWLRAQGFVTGDNEPYSGRLLNATLNRHAEANGIASLSIEVRNDLIADDAGVADWTDVLAALVAHLRNGLAQGSSSKT